MGDRDPAKSRGKSGKMMDSSHRQDPELDVTESKLHNMEMMLLESEDKYRMLIEESTHGIMVIQGSIIKYVNRAMIETFGCRDESEMVEHEFLEFVLPGHCEPVLREMHIREEGGEPLFDYEYIALRKDGSEFEAELGLHAISYQGTTTLQGIVRDITEEKRIRREAEKSRKMFEELRLRALLLDSATDLITLRDMEGNIVYANEKAATISGYSREELLNMSVYQISFIDNRAAIERDTQELIEAGETKCESLLKRKDGSVISMELTHRIIEVGDQKYVLSVGRDISERKTMEEELKLRAQLLDSATDSIFLHDIDGTIYYVNEAAYRSRGYTREELLGINFRQLVVPEYSKHRKSTLRDLLKKGDIVFESAQYRKGGSVLPVEVYARVIETNGKKLILRVDRDISARRKIEEELKLKAQLLDQANDEVIVRDIDGIIVYANEAACRSHGYSKEEMVGMNIRQLIPPEASEIVGERTKEILEKGHKLYEAIHKRQDGSVISLELNSTAFEVGNRNYIITISRDTAERRKMEEELRLRARILDRAMDAIVVRDIEGNIVYVNEVATRVTGSSNEDMIGKNLAQFMKPEQIEQMKYRTGVLLKRGFDRHEGIRVLSDGSVIPIEINSRLFESDGRKLIISVSRDIAERKSMEEELKLKAQLLDNAFDLIFARDEEGNLVYANELACKTLGYRREEITKLKLADILSQYNRDRLTQKTQELLSVGEKEMEVLLVRKDGTQIPVEARSRVVDIDDQKYIISVSRDITQRKKIEEESKLRAHLLDNAKDSIFVYDQEGNLLYVNKEACESRGYTRDELMNMNIRNLTPQRNMTLLEKRLTEWPRQGYGLFEAVHLCKDGSEIPVEIYVRYLEIGDRKLLVSVARDITERKKIEQERHDMEQKAQFSSHLSSIGELAAGVAHEINNPLTAVVGYAQLLMQRDLPEDIIKDLSNIREGAKRVADIVSRLLTFAQRSRLERVYANINEIINTTLSLREYELKTSNIEVITKYAPDLQWTVVDVGQMQQVFLNLIINAETEMRLAHDGGKLSITTKQEDGFIRISFKDNGPGIAKENLERVFDPFFTTREVGQGTGLGLSMCHGIVKEHGGTITVKSAPGKGATFIVELPVVTEPKQLELEESESEIIDVTEQARVLVVDDEPMVGELLTEWLTSLGHKVEVVDNAKDAITMLKEKTYNVILLDIKMPGMSGIELYNYFRKEIPSLLQRIVFITGDVIGYDTQKFLSMTRAYYVTKPFDYEYFKHEINKVMAQA